MDKYLQIVCTCYRSLTEINLPRLIPKLNIMLKSL